MRNILLPAILVVLMSLVSGCSWSCSQDGDRGEFIFHDVKAIWMHQPGDYSFDVPVDEKTHKIATLRHPEFAYDLDRAYYSSERFDDVPEGKPMWVRFTYHHNHMVGECCVHIDSVEIHHHSSRDIQGAGWSQGKFGSGQTNVIEAN